MLRWHGTRSDRTSQRMSSPGTSHRDLHYYTEAVYHGHLYHHTQVWQVRWLHKDIRVYFTPSHKFLLSTYTTTHNSLSTYIIKQKSSCLLTQPHENPPVYLHITRKSLCLLTPSHRNPPDYLHITRKSPCLLTPSHRNPPVYLHHHTEIYLHHQNPWRRGCR